MDSNIVGKRFSKVSIVSIQTDQSRLWKVRIEKVNKYLGFNRINPNRSIPTATLAEPVVARLSDAEWRNLFLKDKID